uniref:Uncharacterized protein n=1 Tax=Tetranychus urticae TaxID=32264 RepID=T1KGI0_TETUR
MSNSNEADNSKIIKFCTAKLGSQCILSRKPYLWIVFSYKSDAQKVLPKVKIIYSDAVISKPPIDLTLQCANNAYILEPPIDLASNRTENELLLKAAIDAAQVLTNERLRSSFFSLDVRDDNDWKIFFRYNSDFIAPMLNYKPNKWSLVFDGNLYCAQFDSASAYQDAYAKIPSRYFRPLEFVNAQDLEGKFKKKLNRYIPDIPWCLNEDLDIHCFVVKIGSPLHDEFIEMSKNILGNRGCIFIKSIPGEIWIGFPDEISRENSEKTVEKFVQYCTKINDVSIAKPSNELLESINFRDLAGDAYDLAFLSSQLEDLKPITRPHIIEEITTERMREQESNDSVFQVTIRGKFCYDYWSSKKVLDKVVKILVYFSKVIPLAVTASDDQVNLMYKTWYEANVARHFINNLREDEVPYLARFHRPLLNVIESFTCSDIYYYIINDQRKVLEKIVQNNSLVDQSDANSSTVQSTSDINVLDEEMKRKLLYLFVITSDSDFKFTSGMISIIKMNLARMERLFYFGLQDKMKYPVCIEFEDEIWVGFDDLEEGNKAKARIEEIKFKILHEHEGDFEVGVVMEPIVKSPPPKVTKMLANKLMNPETRPTTIYMGFRYNAYPLGHFNYSYRKELGMMTSILFD